MRFFLANLAIFVQVIGKGGWVREHLLCACARAADDAFLCGFDLD